MTEEVEKFQFIDLEKDSIKAFMQDRKLWVDLKDHIDPNYYNDKNVSKIFKIFVAFFNKYKDFPSRKQMTSIVTKKNLGNKDINSLISDIYTEGDLSLAEVDYLRDEVIEFVKISKMERAILSSVDLIEQKKYTEIYDTMTQAVHWNPDLNLGTNYANVEARYAKLAELMTNIVETPWPRITHFLGGGFYRKELYLFAASSSVGKSIALDQIALHCWDFLGLNVALISFEMSEERKGQRMDACKFGIPVNKVYDEQKAVFKGFESSKERKNKLFIKEMAQTKTTADIEQYFYQLELYEGVKPDILIVDYMDIMAPRLNKTGKDYDDQGTVGADLRDFGRIYNIPVVSASQFQRTVMDKPIEEISEANIGESWKKVKIADGLIAMGMTALERQNGILNMKGVKNRNGVKDWIVNMEIEYQYLRIIDNKPARIDIADDDDE